MQVLLLVFAIAALVVVMAENVLQFLTEVRSVDIILDRDHVSLAHTSCCFRNLLGKVVLNGDLDLLRLLVRLLESSPRRTVWPDEA